VRKIKETNCKPSPFLASILYAQSENKYLSIYKINVNINATN